MDTDLVDWRRDGSNEGQNQWILRRPRGPERHQIPEQDPHFHGQI